MATQSNSNHYTPAYDGLKHSIESIWNLSPGIRDHLQHHFILYWTPEHFFNQVIDRSIYKEGRLFRVIYHKCSMNDCKNTLNQVALSFRVAKHIHIQRNIHPVVLVSCLPSATHKTRHLTHPEKSGKISSVSGLKCVKSRRL